MVKAVMMSMVDCCRNLNPGRHHVPVLQPGQALLPQRFPHLCVLKLRCFFFTEVFSFFFFFSLIHFHPCFKFTITETATVLTWSSLRFRHSLSVSCLERKVNMLQQKCGVWNTKALHCRFSGDFNWVSVFNLSQCPTTLFSIYKNLTTIFQLLFLSSKQWHRQLAQLTTGSPPVPPQVPAVSYSGLCTAPSRTLHLKLVSPPLARVTGLGY